MSSIRSFDAVHSRELHSAISLEVVRQPAQRLQELVQRIQFLLGQETELTQELSSTAIGSVPGSQESASFMLSEVWKAIFSTRDEIVRLKKEKASIEKVEGEYGAASITCLPDIPLKMGLEVGSGCVEDRLLWGRDLPSHLMDKVIQSCDVKTLQKLSFVSRDVRKKIRQTMGREAALLFVQDNPNNLSVLSNNHNPSAVDPEVVANALRRNPDLFFKLSEELQSDPAIRMAAYLLLYIQKKAAPCQRLLALDMDKIPQGALTEFSKVVATITRTSHLEDVLKSGVLKDSPDALRAFSIVHRRSVSTVSTCACLSYASDLLKRDRNFVLSMVRLNGMNLEAASPVLQGDREIVLAAVRQAGDALFYAAPALQGDREVVLAAVRQDGEALVWAAPALQGDREIVLEAVHQKVLALKYADLTLQNDPEIVQASIQEDPEVLHFISPLVQVILGRLEVLSLN